MNARMNARMDARMNAGTNALTFVPHPIRAQSNSQGC